MFLSLKRMEKVSTYLNLDKAKSGDLFLLRDKRIFEFQFIASKSFSILFGSIDRKSTYLLEDEWRGAKLLDKNNDTDRS